MNCDEGKLVHGSPGFHLQCRGSSENDSMKGHSSDRVASSGQPLRFTSQKAHVAPLGRQTTQTFPGCGVRGYMVPVVTELSAGQQFPGQRRHV